MKFLSRLFDVNERDIGRMRRTVDVISSLEPGMEALSDADLRGRTADFRQRVAGGAKLDEILPHAFATVREAARRTLGQRAFDEQIIGGIVLHEGRIAEMKTGEGKTLTAVFAAYLNALAGNGVHIVTVNDYLARRDSEWMGQIYRFLGLSVGVIVNGMDSRERQASYGADITYGTNNEFGFDYLRDNMVVHAEQMVQKALNYAIVDEVDSILIDEARTPLIISGEADKPTGVYYEMARLVSRMREEEDYTVDEKAHTVTPTDAADAKVEKTFKVDLSDPDGMEIRSYLTQALRARALMKRDVDYVVTDGQVIIVDEFTGRLMQGRRYSDGLHEAIEAKEGLKIERQSQTLATITLQNYFRMYKKLAGMTGTAVTEEEEFQKIYKVDVVVVPTHKKMIREDMPDAVYKTEAAKLRAVVNEIHERHQTGQPLLVGTISIEKSELLSEMLRKRGISHQVLNAKHHEKEAEIVAQAGRLDTVTIATNMAGRGTDILLGGNPVAMARQEMKREGFPDYVTAQASEQTTTEDAEVLAARARFRVLFEEKRALTDAEHQEVVSRGGLHIIGTERHEARRIDNQLRGRTGRQGDPGSSRFYISLEDDLMRLFGADNITGLLDRLGLEEDERIEHGLLSRAIETAQKRVEARNFAIRKDVLEYDDVMNLQREVIYARRRAVLTGQDISGTVREMIGHAVEHVVSVYTPDGVHQDDWDIEALVDFAHSEFFGPGLLEAAGLQDKDRKALMKDITAKATERYAGREASSGTDLWRQIERFVVLSVVDQKWKDHLETMDHLREGIGLRAYGQRDPLLEYKSEAYNYFKFMMESIEHDTVKHLFLGRFEVAPEMPRPAQAIHQGPAQAASSASASKKRVGRNDLCPCGSGKKYKKCCGRHE